MLRRDPHQFGVARARWTLATLLAQLPWLRLGTLSGLWRLLRRLGIRYKRARAHIHSPDPAYAAKLAAIATARRQADAQPDQHIVLYLDEMTLYRQPTLAAAYEAQGATQPLAEHTPGRNIATRVIATLDPRDGRVVYYQGRKIGRAELRAFYQQVRAAYPTATRIWLVLDNWPMHWHPEVLPVLEAQETAFAPVLPPSWRGAAARVAAAPRAAGGLPIQLVPLPTYASWCNPIEKLWRKLRQEEGHLHRQAGSLAALRQLLTRWLDGYAAGSHQLLEYVGLLS